MNRATSALIILEIVGLGLLVGCRDTAPPPRVPVPTQYDRHGGREADEMRPLPPPAYPDTSMQPPYDDVPLVSQRPPEQRAFVEAHQRVGSPRITLFVNRTLEGNIIPVNPTDPLVSVERTRTYQGKSSSDRQDTVDVYLRPGQYDEVDARAIDYGAIEAIMTDWLASNGQVTVVSPTMARQRLSDQQVKELQEGRPQALSEIAQQLSADVLVQVQARPTRQTREGLEVRIIAEAINTRGGESIGRAVVDVPPPLEKVQINDYTRFLARKLMDDMTQTWHASPRPAQTPRPAAPAAPPAEPPATGPSARDSHMSEFPN